MTHILRARQNVKINSRKEKAGGFHIGTVIYGYDKILKKIIGGYITETFIEDDKQHLTIRWSDPFIAIEYCSAADLRKRLKSKERRLG
jgi:hypothetical protein